MLKKLRAGQRLSAAGWLLAAMLMGGCPGGGGGDSRQTNQGAAPAPQSQAEPQGGAVARGAAGAERQPAGEAETEAAEQFAPAQSNPPAAGYHSHWWGEGSDPHRQNYSANRGPDHPQLRWSAELGRNFSGRLVMSGGLVVAGVTAARQRAGFMPPEERYAIDVEGLPDQVPAGAVVGVSPDGALAWRVDTQGGPLLCAALVPEPRVYAQYWWRRFEEVRRRGNQPKTLVMLECELAAIDPAGRQLWTVGAHGTPLGDPLLGPDGAVYSLEVHRENIYHNQYYDHSLTASRLACYDPAGEERWQYPLTQLDECWGLTPACQLFMLPGGSLGFSWNDNTFHSFKPDGGKDWVYGLQSVPDGAGAASPSGDVVLPANDRPELNDKQLEVMNWESMNSYGVLHVLKGVGSLRWEVQVGSDVHSAVAIDAEGVIHFGTTLYEQDREHFAKNGRVYAIAANKQFLWRYDTHADFADTPLQPDPLVDSAGVLYISDAGRHLYALNPDGSLKWEYASPRGFATNPVLGPDGTLYIGGTDGKLYALGD